MNKMLSIDSTKCIQCGFCADECPNYVFKATSDGTCKQVEVRYPEQCCACGHCVAICPSEAIGHSKMSGEKFENLLDIEIPPQHMRSLLLSRRSIRAFKEEPVSDELVVELIEAGIHAGTASNGQT
ncbi:MAG: 4Fe-4S binding protein [Syntrophorhabdales bacterium]